MDLSRKSFVDKIKYVLENLFIFPFYILTHPIKGYEDLKFAKKGKMWVATLSIILLIITQILVETQTGFLVINSAKRDFSLLRTILIIIFLVGLFVIGNWSVTSLFDGKGKVKEIFLVIGYSFIPFILIVIPLTIISNFIVSEEINFYRAIYGLAVGISAYMVFMGLIVIHEYGVLKNIVTLIATFLSVALIIFIMILLLTIVQQIYSFLKQIIEEIILRLTS